MPATTFTGKIGLDRSSSDQQRCSVSHMSTLFTRSERALSCRLMSNLSGMAQPV